MRHGAGEYVGTYFLALGVHGGADFVHQRRHLIGPELGPFLHLGRVFHGLDVNASEFLESGGAVVAVAVVGRGIFLVHYQTVLVPQAAGEDDVRVADVVQLNVVHLGNLGDGGHLVHQVLVNFRIAGIQGLVIGNVGGIFIGRLSQAVHGIPAVGLVSAEHAGNPGMVFQTFRMGTGGSLGHHLRIAVFQAHAHDALGLPEMHLLLELVHVRLFIDALPHIDGEGFFLLGAGGQEGGGCEENEC